MAEMVLAEQQLCRIEAGIDFSQLAVQQMALEQLFAQPDRHSHEELAKATRRHRHIGLEQPLELEEGLLVENHRIKT